MRIYIFFLVTFSFLSCDSNNDACSKYSTIEKNKEYEYYESIIEQGDIDEAVKIIKNIVKNDPNNYRALSDLGAILYNRDCHFKDCNIELLKSILDLHLNSHSICNDYKAAISNAVYTYTQLHGSKYQNSEEIIRLCDLYRSRFKEHYAVEFSLGKSLFHEGHYENAIKHLNNAYDLDSTSSNTLTFIGKFYSVKKEYDKSLNYLNAAIKIDSNSLAFHERAYIHEKMDEIDMAKSDYKTAISLNSKRFESYVGLGIIERKKGDILKACELFSIAFEMNPNDKTVNSWIKGCR